MSTWFDFLPVWRFVLRGVLGLAFVGAGLLHFGRLKKDYQAMVPARLGNAGFWVAVTGVLEPLGGIGLVMAPTARLSSVGLAALLVAVFPANIRAAAEHLTFAGRRQPSVAVRGSVQVVVLALVLIAGFA
jgi:uncharacterized membrane protein